MTNATQAPEGWKNYDDFSSGIDTNRLPKSTALDGQKIALTFEDGRRLSLSFGVDGKVLWSEGGTSGTEDVDVVEVAADTYFVDFSFIDLPTEAETLIINTKTCRVLSIHQRVRSAKESVGEPRVAQTYRAGTIDGGEVTGEAPAATRDLVGHVAHYTYSPNHVYEHYYMSSERYFWQCLKGVQHGDGDVDMTTTYKFSEGQYIFSFREFIIPVASVFFYNYDEMRSTGKFLGVEGDGTLSNRRAGAHIRKVTKINYQTGEEPT